MEKVAEKAPPLVRVEELEWVTARYPDEDFDRGAYRDIGGALGTVAVGANIHRLEPSQENARYHAHEVEEELFLVLDGSPTLRLDGRVFRLSKGHVVHSPPWSAHTFRNESDDPCSILMASNRAPRPDVVYPGWKAEARGAGENLKLDPTDPRVRHTAEMGWEDDPFGRHWGGARNLTERMSLDSIGCELRTLRAGALVPLRAYTRAEAIYMVLAGTVEMLRGDRVLELPEGSAVRVPADTPHAFRLRRREQARLWGFCNRPEGNAVESPTPPQGWEAPIRL